MRRTKPQTGNIYRAYRGHLFPSSLWHIVRGSVFHWKQAEECLVEKHLLWAGKLKHERELRSWTQAYVAESVGVDPKTVSRWENGQYPQPLQRQKLAELFDKTPGELGFVETD